MLNYLYYLASFLGIGTVGYGVCYVLNKERTEEVTQNILWKSVKQYHRLKLDCMKFKNWYVNRVRENMRELREMNGDGYYSDEYSEDDESDNETNKKSFFGYNKKDGSSFKTNDLNCEYLKDEDFDLMFLIEEKGNQTSYKRVLDKSELDKIKDENFEIVEKPFIQVEYEVNDKKFSIHKNLKKFYVEDTSILDVPFLEWYMKEFYDEELSEDYKLKVIDSEVNMLTLDKTNSINIKDGKYEVVV